VGVSTFLEMQKGVAEASKGRRTNERTRPRVRRRRRRRRGVEDGGSEREGAEQGLKKDRGGEQ